MFICFLFSCCVSEVYLGLQVNIFNFVQVIDGSSRQINIINVFIVWFFCLIGCCVMVCMVNIGECRGCLGLWCIELIIDCCDFCFSYCGYIVNVCGKICCDCILV